MEVTTPKDLKDRVEVVRRRDAFERDKAGFVAAWTGKEEAIRRKIVRARKLLGAVEVPDAVVERAAEICLALGTDGLRGELILMRAARALAALDGKKTATVEHLRRVAPMTLRHRLRRDPLDDVGASVRVERVLDECFAA